MGETITDSGGDAGDVAGAAVATTVASPGGGGERGGADDAGMIGAAVGRYRIEARLGAGGMGVVWAARDPALDRRVALKMLPPRSPERRAHLEIRLRREAQALARLDHRHVIAVYDVGVAAESVFVAMQLVDGVTLDRWIAAHAPPPARIVATFVDAARGLAAAHAAGIVHRDVKPSNLLVDRGGRVYVGDFGLARSDEDERDAGGDDLLAADMTGAGSILGTPLYMSPEQHAGAPATARSDQFSLCVSLWEALYGAHPFVEGTWRAEAARAAMRDDRVVPPRRRGAGKHVERALRRGLRFEPDARWPSMEALAAALASRRRGAWIAAAAAAIAVVAAIVVAIVVTRSPADRAPGAAALLRPGPRAPLALQAQVAAMQEVVRGGGNPVGARALAEALEAAGDRALAADVWWMIAQAEEDQSSAEQRHATRKAAEAATAIGDHPRAAVAYAKAATTAAAVGDDDAVDDLIGMAGAAAELAQRPDVTQRVDVARAWIAVERRDLDGAAAIARRVIAATEGQPLRDARSDAFDVLLDVLLRGGEWAALAEAATRWAALSAETWGPTHPYRWQPMHRLAIAKFHLGDRAGARALWAEAARGIAADFGPDSLRLLDLHQDAANAESEGGTVWTPEAIAAVSEAAAVARRALPADDPRRAVAVTFDGSRRGMTGDIAGARAAFAEVLPVFAREPDLAYWAQVSLMDADLARQLGACDAATVRLALVIDRARDGQVAPHFADLARCGLGACRATSRRAAERAAGRAELEAAAAALTAAGFDALAPQCRAMLPERR